LKALYPHIEPKQTISALVIMPLFINAKEQEMNIKNGTEVMLLGWGVDGLDNFLVLGSSANGINVDGLGITKVENLKEVKIIAPKITLSDNTGDREDINQEDILAKETTVLTEKIEIKNENVEVIDNWTKTQQQLIELANAVASLQTIVTSGSSAGEYSHSEVGTANLVSSETAKLKAKLMTLKK